MAQGNEIDVVVAGHLCLDIIPTIEQRVGSVKDLIAPGKLVNVGEAVMSTGGAVSNTGLALHRLGLTTKLAGKIGDDVLGKAILDVLKRFDGAPTDGIVIDKDADTSYTIVVIPWISGP